jgi:hypothetical protein
MASTPLLGLSLPADGTTNWGALVNTSITALLDSAIAGTTILSSDADVTLTTTAEASNQARQVVLLCTGSRAAVRNITAPAQSKTYVVINNTVGGFGVTIRGVGPTTGVTVPSGKTFMVAWNGSDFALVSTEIAKRVVSTASATSVTPNSDTTDILIQANTEPIGTLTINAPIGSPVNGQTFVFRLSSTAVQTFAWNAIYQGSTDSPLPSASSGAGKTDYMGFIYNTSNSKWQMLAKNFGF